MKLTPFTRTACFTILGCCLLLTDPSLARYYKQKKSGISDQRLAELETLIALSKMKGKMVTVPIAFGVIDPEEIGKRSTSSYQPEVSENRENEYSSHVQRSNRKHRGDRNLDRLIWRSLPNARIPLSPPEDYFEEGV